MSFDSESWEEGDSRLDWLPPENLRESMFSKRYTFAFHWATHALLALAINETDGDYWTDVFGICVLFSGARATTVARAGGVWVKTN